MSRSLGVPALLVVLSAVLIFPNLDNRYLWDDEAETALLARTVLRFGVPVAWDGRDLVSQECGDDYDANYLWRQTPWLPIYATAASFKLLGATTFAARLPFAALGVLSVLSLYGLAAALFRDRALALLAALCLLASVPFLLYVRQCRYYSVAIFAAIWVLRFFFGLLHDRRFAVLALALALTALFHANYLLALATVAGLAAASAALAVDRRTVARLAVAGAAALVLALPWITVFDLRGKSAMTLANASVSTYVNNLWAYASRIDLYALPAVLLPLIVLVRLVQVRRAPQSEWPHRSVGLALVALALAHLGVVSLMPASFFRYVVTLLPIFALLLAGTIRAVWAQSRALAIATLAFALLADRAGLGLASPGSPLVKYADEVTHDIPGPIEAIVLHLRAEARPGDRVFISYGDLPLRFYTGLEIRGGQGCQSLAGWPPPEWIIERFFFRFSPTSPEAQEDFSRTLAYLREVPRHLYRSVSLPGVDTVWENIPEPEWHVFRAPREGPRVVVRRKIEPRQQSPGHP